MCGILAFFSANGAVDTFRCRIADSLELLHHRGPDDTGVQIIDDEVIFGHKRLSIIDVELSREPLPYQGKYLLTFNGEIYNYLELREELIRRKAPVKDIRELRREICAVTGVPRPLEFEDEVVGLVEYRDGTIIDAIRKVKE